ncbi:hypothetical protein KDJ01_gp26 [Arthrobacter phage Kittykat]|uniref:Uncharacterized protein n=1 Tax=Arthrobacter phage Kittykat TaxID=2794944 RepID=A0A7T1KRZ0_9CAUD|nr:hypothetical protein KDJ01_gp26 [Arthrobacter phage Kittykat]QPO16958.1 hypothetical protein SEA_KITTYKAT_26 [Arthrobacter phage Kittykat]
MTGWQIVWLTRVYGWGLTGGPTTDLIRSQPVSVNYQPARTTRELKLTTASGEPVVIPANTDLMASYSVAQKSMVLIKYNGVHYVDANAVRFL